jgi:hypothetical protein
MAPFTRYLAAALAVAGGLACAQSAPFSLTSADVRSTLVPAGQVNTTMSIVVDSNTIGGELLDIVSSDPSVVVSVTMPGGAVINSTTATSLGFTFSQTTVDPNAGDGPTIFDVPGTHTSIYFPAGSPIGAYEITADGRAVTATAFVRTIFVSYSSIAAGIATSDARVIAGTQATLIGALTNGTLPIAGASAQVSLYQVLPVSGTVSTPVLLPVSQTQLDPQTVSAVYSVRVTNNGASPIRGLTAFAEPVSSNLSLSRGGAVGFGDIDVSTSATSAQTLTVTLLSSRQQNEGWIFAESRGGPAVI